MEDAYRPEAWHDLYIMVGGAAAVLTGLIFVAVSLHLRAVLHDPWRRGRAGSSLLALMSVVLISGALLAPPQPAAALGLEIAAISLANPAYSIVGLVHLRGAERRRALPELVLGIIVALLAVGAGVSLAAGAGGGLWLLLPGAATALTSSVVNSWRLMVGVAEGSPTEAH
ncbi:MAG: hypothetical protein ACXWMX_01465 [Candidatus Limnocylindrales bacterium]